jgi:hypothetical protein
VSPDHFIACGYDEQACKQWALEVQTQRQEDITNARAADRQIPDHFPGKEWRAGVGFGSIGEGSGLAFEAAGHEMGILRAHWLEEFFTCII